MKTLLNEQQGFQLLNFTKVQIVFALLSLFLCLIVFICHTVYPICLSLNKKEIKGALYKKALKGLALSSLILGWFVYFVGFCEEGTSRSFVAAFFRPLLSSLEHFVFHSDLLEVSKQCHASRWYMTVYTVAYVSAAFVSSTVVVNCLWRRLYFSFRRLWWSITNCQTINVFFGINDKSLCLAESIKQHLEENKNEDHCTERIVFISFPNEKEESHGHNSLSKLFGLRSWNREKVDAIRKMDGVIINASSALFDDTNAEKAASSYVLESNGLWRLTSVLNQAKKIRLFFLSENENENIRAGINMEHSQALSNKIVDIYCKARKSYENYTLIDNSSKALYHLVDDSSLAVSDLMLLGNEESRTPVAHPINYVKVNPSFGTVESKFTCLIVGFGQTGQDAMRFFYEFGSFVGKDGHKSPFLCRVVDKNMNALYGDVAREIPALQIGKGNPDSLKKRVLGEEVELCHCDADSAEFWTGLEKVGDSGKMFIQEVNCIVVAIGSDEENIALAAKIHEFAIRHNAVKNKDMGCLKIFVRAYNADEESRLQKVAEYYNKENDVIRLFGKIKNIYSYSVIIDNHLRHEAKLFFDSYNSVTGYPEDWNMRHNELRSGTMARRNEVRIKEGQDYSNALHQKTKLQLLGLVESEARPLPSKYPFISEGDLNAIMQGKLKFDSEMDKETMLWYVRLQNVSICEHIRWASSLYMSGFIREDDKTKDFRIRRHKYLVDWNETAPDKNGVLQPLLTDEIKKFDYMVVVTTIRLH